MNDAKSGGGGGSGDTQATQQHNQLKNLNKQRASDTSLQTGAAATTDLPAAAVPRRPRPLVHRATNAQLLRRGQFVAFAATSQQQQQQQAAAVAALQRQHGTSIVLDPQTASFVGMPITAQIELAGVLQPAGRVTTMPPKRPSYLPTRAEQLQQQQQQMHHHHHRFAPQQLTTSLGATALTTSSTNSKPNRYSWAQMQHWHAAQSAAAAARQQQQQQLDGSTGELFGGQQAKHDSQSQARGFHYHFTTPFGSSAASRLLVVPNPIVNLGEHTKSRLIKIIEALKHFSEKWFSHVLLLFFLASYACLGAYIFISFEAPTEQWEKQLIIETRARIVNESYDQAHELGTRELFVETFRVRFEDYERLLNRMCASGMTSSSLENQWTFWGALFYSMTVFTTIGYGHLTPITFAGRVATMIYAIFGIPILLMVLADLGKLLTRIIKYAFKKFRYWYNKLLGRKASVRTRKLITDHSNQYIGVARSAFERGFATYIQPYQSRIPGALRDAQMRMATHLRHHNLNQQQQQPAQATADAMCASGGDIDANNNNGASGTIQIDAAGNTILLVDGQQQQQQAENPINVTQSIQEPLMESSEIIVTPAKQTKPVSPKITATNNNKLQHPLAIETQIDREGNSLKQSDEHPQQQQQQQQTHKRSQSPFGSKRKISASSKHQRKNSVSRSSSSSNVATSGERQARSAVSAKKRASVDHQNTSAGLLGAHSSANLLSSNVDLEQQQQQQDSLNGAAHEQLNNLGTGQHQLAGEDEEAAMGLESGDFVGGEEDEEEEDLDEDLDIPVSFALFLLITYMMFGAVVFSIWESWNFFDALYFVFISMSTIGFGDLVPQHPKRMIGTFAYLLFGLALTSMCINVVQEKIHATFLRAKMQIGEKMGFDLDQIMADDYYDSNSAYDADHLVGLEHEDDIDEPTGSCSNSLAVSQTNSHTGAEQPQQAIQASNPPDLRAGVISQLDQHHHQPEGGGKSKSRESLKWKNKKSNSGGVLSSDQHAASSIKRKSSNSTINKKLVRQTSPSASAAVISGQASSPISPNQPAPIKSQLETIRMFNLPVQSQVDDGQHKQRSPPTQPVPHINQPIAASLKSFCGPLKRVFQGASNVASGGVNPSKSQPASSSSNNNNLINSDKPSLLEAPSDATTSQQRNSPLAVSKSLDSAVPPAHNNANQGAPQPHNGFPQPHHQNYQPATAASIRAASKPQLLRNNATSDSDNQSCTSVNLHQRNLHHSERSRRSGGKALSRSLNSSRRASVSHELSQLDDLIVALSSSPPPERFGPLLGIPNTSTNNTGGRPLGRSVSPRDVAPSQWTSSNNNHLHLLRPQSSIGGGLLPPLASEGGSLAARRRGTSMMIRPTAAQSGQLRSLNQMSPSPPPSSRLSNHLTSSHGELEFLRDQRRKSSASSAAASASSRPFQIIHKNHKSHELNLSESQAALDELEAVKYSAV